MNSFSMINTFIWNFVVCRYLPAGGYGAYSVFCILVYENVTVSLQGAYDFTNFSGLSFG